MASAGIEDGDEESCRPAETVDDGEGKGRVGSGHGACTADSCGRTRLHRTLPATVCCQTEGGKSTRPPTERDQT